MQKPITRLIDDLAGPGSHETDAEWTFPWEVLRYAPDASTVKLPVEILIWDNKSRYYASVPSQINLPEGWAIQADSVLMLTQAELDEINASDELCDWIKEGLEADSDARSDQADREREFAREARYYGLIK